MRRAKHPDEKCKWWDYKTNRYVLKAIELTISGEINVINAFTWSDTKEGHNYWRDFRAEPHQEGWDRLKAMANELSMPNKPINKKDWL